VLPEEEPDVSFADFGDPERPFCEAALPVKPVVTDPCSAPLLLAA
jgi:hypothetical protein